jgi:hypothetical protein
VFHQKMLFYTSNTWFSSPTRKSWAIWPNAAL